MFPNFLEIKWCATLVGVVIASCVLLFSDSRFGREVEANRARDSALPTVLDEPYAPGGARGKGTREEPLVAISTHHWVLPKVAPEDLDVRGTNGTYVAYKPGFTLLRLPEAYRGCVTVQIRKDKSRWISNRENRTMCQVLLYLFHDSSRSDDARGLYTATFENR